MSIWDSMESPLSVGSIAFRARDENTRKPHWESVNMPFFVAAAVATKNRSEEHTSELQSQSNLVCRLLLEKKKNAINSVPILSFAKLQGLDNRTTLVTLRFRCRLDSHLLLMP